MAREMVDIGALMGTYTLLLGSCMAKINANPEMAVAEINMVANNVENLSTQLSRLSDKLKKATESRIIT